MPIPANIQAVIDAANVLQSAETRWQKLKDDKTALQAQIAAINDQLDLVGDEVATARLNLKAAAQGI